MTNTVPIGVAYLDQQIVNGSVDGSPIGELSASTGQFTDVGCETLIVTDTLIVPKMTGTARDAISAPVSGMLIYNTTTNKLNFYAAAAWEAVTSS